MAGLAHQDWRTVYVRKRHPAPSARNGPNRKTRSLDEHHRTGERLKAPPAVSARSIIVARSARGWTQAQLATQLHVKPAVVRSWEQNQARPSGKNLADLRKMLKI